MPPQPIFTPECFRFFRDLGRNNRKEWMDENRARYHACVVEPFRRLCDELAPAVKRLDPNFVVSGRANENFSRINRDIRFANDKSPYRTQMYLKFSGPAAKKEGDGELYVGLTTDAATAGFRSYFGSRQSTLARFGIPRARENPGWIERQQRRIGKRYESYWYFSYKGQWTKHPGWPIALDDWVYGSFASAKNLGHKENR
jgi:uncharacterized protein (DUF2461 family)